MRIWPGNPYPLGATWDGSGVNFAIFAEHATGVELCLFDSPDAKYEFERIPLPEQADLTWHVYNPLACFAPDTRYLSAGDGDDSVREFKRMVRALHAAGLEVILDVVYNHACGGNQMEPTFFLRGIDNPAYYRLLANDLRCYRDYTGCGNTLFMRPPRVRQLIMDSLRYWMLEMHVDGFRFDLAATLAVLRIRHQESGG